MIRIESSRWDALALTQRLAPYHWFLVERGHDHWEVYLAVEEHELPHDLRTRLDAWVKERQIEAAIMHSDDGDIRLSCL